MEDNDSVSMVGDQGSPVPSPDCLMKAEVSWMSTVRGNLSYEERILMRVTGILNKLTVEKYTLLKTQLIDSGITNPSILYGIASLIFHKALAEPMFCPMYAFLCSELSVYLPSFPSDDEPHGKEITFRRFLVNNCQEAFENEDMRAEQMRQQIMTGSSSREYGWRRSLRYIHFISELSKQAMFWNISCIIVMELVKQNDVDKNVRAVCLLLKTMGKKLDELCTKASKKKELSDESPNNEHPGRNETCFGWLKDILTTHPQLETRLKLMIRDLLELRANNWVDLRHNKFNKTIPELISASEAKAFSRLHLGSTTSTNTKNHRAVQFRPMNQPDPRRW